MNHVQDPNRQVGYLQQCLSSDKKPLGLFLGAGCPMALRTGDGQSLIPDIAGITKMVCDDLAKSKDCGPLLKIIEGHFVKDERHNATIEDMLTHIRSLRAVVGKDEVRGLSVEKLDQLDDRICQLIHQVVDKPLPNNNTAYHHIAAWVDAVHRETPVEIFTTNYDLLMEQAFEDSSVPYFDGFAGGRKPFFDLRAMEEDILPPRWARLWKLHGSVNWYQVDGKGVFRSMTMEDGGTKRVIHPSHLKYQESRRMPYLAMLDRLRAFLKQPTATLILCGYSFRDQHLNEVIVQGLQCTQTAIAFALLFDNVENYTPAVAIASSRSNLNILARNGGVIGGQKSKWQEKDAASVSADNGQWIKWTNSAPAKINGKHTAELTLGDFAVLGQFLQELTGGIRQTREVPNA